jgi:hypothetical protein
MENNELVIFKTAHKLKITIKNNVLCICLSSKIYRVCNRLFVLSQKIATHEDISFAE